MVTPNTISELIAKWGKLTEFAAAVECGYEAARKMRDRESIAPEHWAKVIVASDAKGIPGITYEWLAIRRAAASEKEQAA
jgi:hypothetical protein